MIALQSVCERTDVIPAQVHCEIDKTLFAVQQDEIMVAEKRNLL